MAESPGVDFSDSQAECRVEDLTTTIEAAGQDRTLELIERIRALSRRASQLRLERGHAARPILANKSWLELGFVRLADYTRERLGLAARTVEEEVAVAEASERLPACTAAFREGDLPWSQFRRIARVATSDDEIEWLEMARRGGAAALDESIRARRGGAAASEGSAPLRHDDGIATPTEEEAEVRFSVRISRAGRRLWRLACEFAERTAGSRLSQSQVLELVVAEASASANASFCRGRTAVAPVNAADAAEPTADAFATTQPCAECKSARDPASSPAATSSSDTTTSAGSSPASDATIACDPVLIDQRLREITSAMKRIDAELAGLLRRALEWRVYREEGFSGFGAWVEERLDLCARKAWSLVALDRAAAKHCDELATAWSDGRLSALAASAVLPVISAGHGRAWVERASIVTLRRLQAEVTWALDRRDAMPGVAGFDPPAPPPLDSDLGLPGIDDLSAGATATTDAAADAGVQIGAPPAPLSVTLHFYVAPELAELATDVMHSLRVGSEPIDVAFERMVAMALLAWLAEPKHRDPVFERDGWLCAVPACGSRRNLHDHHIVFRSLGGSDARDNRTTVCAAHHLHGLHAGRIRATGRAPDEIVWELGCGRDGKVLARLVGDRYVERH